MEVLTDINKAYIQTHSGIKFTVFNPQPEMILIEDIAHALSMLCRYGGHSKEFYSVARHSIITSYLVPEKFALCALLHDSTEAYCADVPRPIKYQIKQYTEIEDKLYEKIAQKFNLPCPIPLEVKKADDDMLYFEWDYFMEKNPIFELMEFYAKYFQKRTIDETKYDFLQRFDELSKRQIEHFNNFQLNHVDK